MLSITYRLDALADHGEDGRNVLVDPALAVVQHNHRQLRRRSGLLLRLACVFQHALAHVEQQLHVPGGVVVGRSWATAWWEFLSIPGMI